MTISTKPHYEDQDEWDSCVSWQRMLVAIVANDMDPAPSIMDFALLVTKNLKDGKFVASSIKKMLDAENYYGACLEILEQQARNAGITGPERLHQTGVGRGLCAAFRGRYRVAMPGFTHIGKGGREKRS